MKRLINGLKLCLLISIIYGCTHHETLQQQGIDSSATPCSPDWFNDVESSVGSGDGQGHGPDMGSLEWRSVIEFKLGLRGSPLVPNRQTDEWCEFIDARVFKEAR